MHGDLEMFCRRLMNYFLPPPQDIECEGLQQRLTDLSRTHEALLVEKTDTINQLMANLEESQRQCQKLIANIDNGKTAAEKEQLEKDVQKLQVTCNYVIKRMNE